MIGTRGALSGAITLALVVVSLGPGGPRPEVALGSGRLVADSARAGDAALASLQTRLGTVLDTAREGAAAIVAGDRLPGESLQEAADLLLDAATVAADAESAVRALDAARRARDPDVGALPDGPDAAVLGSISAQLADTIEVADLFAEMRRRAANVPAALDAALAALRVEDLEGAAAGAAAARADIDAVAGWDVDFLTLPVWIETSDAVVHAVERLIAAVTSGDAAGAERAAADFADLEPDATDADRALQIAISEGAGTIVSAPLARLTAAIDAVGALRADVGVLVAEGGR